MYSDTFFGYPGIPLYDRVNQVVFPQRKLLDGHRSRGFVRPAPCQKHSITGKQKGAASAPCTLRAP